MSAMQTEIAGSRVLDLFAGSGALGFELLSRGAEHVTFVERGAPALRTLKTNAEKLAVAGSEFDLVRGDAIEYVANLEQLAYDLAVADPPYHQGLAADLLQLFAKKPFARWFWVEHGSTESLPELPDMNTRRYGDTALTSITAPE
jgi:16S rRNA (guanine966-N2)-methyltransferase